MNLSRKLIHFPLLQLRNLIQEAALLGGQAPDSLRADLVEHPVHFGCDRIGSWTGHLANWRGSSGLGVTGSGLDHDDALDLPRLRTRPPLPERVAS